MAGEGGRRQVGVWEKAAGFSRNETLAPAFSKKASGLRGCSPAVSVFPSVTCRSQGLKADPQGTWAREKAGMFLEHGGLLPAPWTGPWAMMFIESAVF